MEKQHELKQQIIQLNRQVKFLTFLITTAGSLFAIWYLSGLLTSNALIAQEKTTDDPKEEVARFAHVRVKSLIVEDADGNDRIVISPQIKKTKSRAQSHLVNGVLILDENGNDRVAVGASPFVKIRDQVFPRIDNDIPWGICFHNETGSERGGFGYYQKRDLVTFGMDSGAGEGLVMWVAEEGKQLMGQKSGILMKGNRGKPHVFIGAGADGGSEIGLEAPGKARLQIDVDREGNSSLTHQNLTDNSKKTVLETKN